MESRTVLLFLCMFCARTACRPAGSGDAEEASRSGLPHLLLREIQEALVHLNHAELIPNILNCSSLNVSELVGLKQPPLSSRDLSSLRCYMKKLTESIPELSDEMLKSCQFVQDLEQLSGNATTSRNCSLPSFEQELDGYFFGKCFLQLVEERLKTLLRT